MIHVSIRRVRPGKADRLRAWLRELNARAEDVRATFRDESVREEQAFVVEVDDRTILVYVSEASDLDKARAAFAESQHPIDLEHRRVIEECVGEKLVEGPIYALAHLDTKGSR